MAPAPGKANANAYPNLNQITDVPTRNAVKFICDQVAQLQGLSKTIGGVSKPLTQHLNAGSNRLTKLQDPLDPQDAVTLKFLQDYVANFASAFQSSSESGAGGGTGNTPAPPTAPAPTNQGAIVESVRVTLGISAASTPAQLFKFAQTVVWNINALGPDPVAGNVGMLMQAAGDGVYFCSDMGLTVACFRICYDNGANIKILTGSYTSQWTQEADVPVTDWTAPTDPATVCP